MSKPVTLEGLLQRYFKLQHKQILAHRHEDIPAYNRMYEGVWYDHAGD